MLFTWCQPGYPGYHHVNCQLPEYWIPKFQARGYRYDGNRSRDVQFKNLFMVKAPFWRDDSLNKKQVFKPYLRDWGMVFIR